MSEAKKSRSRSCLIVNSQLPLFNQMRIYFSYPDVVCFLSLPQKRICSFSTKKYQQYRGVIVSDSTSPVLERKVMSMFHEGRMALKR